MGDQQQQIPSAPFPAPPPFWKHFTCENLSRLKALKGSNTKAEDMPLELTYLEPPPPPEENYAIFGEEQKLSTTLPPLTTRGITQLYPSPTPSTPLDHPSELLALLKSLHLNFQEAILILSRNPSLIHPKFEDIKNLFQNVHWLINMYRPHQARESLIAMMEGLVEEGKREMEDAEGLRVRVEGLLGEIERGGTVGGAVQGGEYRQGVSNRSGTASAESVDEEEDARRLWKKMTDIDIEAD